MKLFCKYCKIQFECSTFEQVASIQNAQCYITRDGITHDLRAVVE